MRIKKFGTVITFFLSCFFLHEEVFAKKNKFNGLKTVGNLEKNKEALSKKNFDIWKNSIKDIKDIDILSIKRIWLELHLQEKINAAFVVPGNEFVGHIIRGVKEGKITPYSDELCQHQIVVNMFFSNIMKPNKEDEETLYFRAREISKLRFVVDVIIDNVRAEPVLKVMYVVLVIPGMYFSSNLDRVVAAFKFDDLQKYFDTIPAESSWINVNNKKDSLSFSSLFGMYHMWVPQCYFIKDDKDDDKSEPYKVKGVEKDLLVLRKTKLINDIEQIWVY